MKTSALFLRAGIWILRTPIRYSRHCATEHTTSHGKLRLTLNKRSSYDNLVLKIEAQKIGDEEKKSRSNIPRNGIILM